MIAIEAPTVCPACNTELEYKNDVIYCINELCEAKTQKVLQHWAKTMKIKGLGPQTLIKLGVSSVQGLYDLSITDITSIIGTKVGEKVYAEVVNSRLAPLDIILPAFGINLIGNSATNKLKTTISTLDELTREKAIEAGLGPKTADNLMSWFETKYLPLYKGKLPFSFKFTEMSSTKTMELKGIVCISGKLVSYKTKAEAGKVLQECGYRVKSSLTKDVTILVNESGTESAKTQKARANGVTIIEDLKQLTGA